MEDKELFEIHAIDYRSGGGGGIGYQSNEAHCRRTAKFLSGHAEHLWFECGKSRQGQLFWETFAYYYRGQEFTLEEFNKLWESDFQFKINIKEV